MSEENKENTNTEPTAQPSVDTNKGAAEAVAKSVYGREQRGRRDQRQMRRGGPRKRDGESEEFEQKIIDVARVTRVMAGGKRMRFRACVAVGNKKGKVAIGLAKGADVTNAIAKAATKAKKDFIDVKIVNDTIPHAVYQKTGAAKILFKPAKQGRGIIAGGAARIVLELSGIKNITCKTLGTSNKLNNAMCVIDALKSLKQGKKKEEKTNKHESETN